MKMSLHARETPIMLHLHLEDVGSILRWSVAEGEQVQRGDVLASVELGSRITHRVTTEDAGRLYRKLVEDGPIEIVCTPIPIDPNYLHQWLCIGVIIPSDTE